MLYQHKRLSLVAEQVAQVVMYGSFVEDGLEAQVSNVATVMLHNTGPAVTWTQVMIQTNGGVLTFCASMLPAGSRVMVLERDARRYPVGALTACRGQAVLAEESWMDEARLQFADIDMGTMAVTNLTDSHIKNLLIYYKTHYGDVDIFLGGVTYFHKVEALDGGETVLIQPDHYAKGYSQIVRVSME